MKKNIVFIPYIDMGDGRSSSYAYSIKSWEKFCERHNAEIIVWQDLIVPIEEMKITCDGEDFARYLDASLVRKMGEKKLILKTF